MSTSSNQKAGRVLRVIAAAAAMALPTVVLAQGQIDTSRGNEANNRIGSGGRNSGPGGVAQTPILSNGNRVVTGNVSLGREFHGTVGYTDPFAFRGPTAGSGMDNFSKNSNGVPMAHAPEPVPNRATSYYGASQTVQAPPGTFLAQDRNAGFVAPPAGAFRAPQDVRVGELLNRPFNAVPMPGELNMVGSLNPQAAATQQRPGILSASPLYAVRELNPSDPADRVFLDNIMSRQNAANTGNADPREVRRMQEELNKALGEEVPGATDVTRTQGSLMQKPLGAGTLETPASPAVNNAALTGDVKNPALNAADMSTGGGIRFGTVGAARKTSTQYTELSKRLEQFYADRPKTDADYAREFNAEQQRLKDAAKTAKPKNPAVADVNPTPVAPPATPDLTKPKVKKPAPMKVSSLAQGVAGEGLGNVLKKAETLMKEGKYSSALEQYDQAEAVTPNNPMVWLGRANAELGAGFFARAEEHLRQALSTDKALLMGQYDLTGMLGEERLTKVVAELKDIANKENKPGPLFMLAYVAYNTGHERQALGYLDLAEKRGGDQAGFYKMLRDHWALPDEGGAKPEGGGAAKPDLNK